MAVAPPPAKPGPKPVPKTTPLDDRIQRAELDRLRRHASETGLRDNLQKAAGAGGKDPYAVLAEAIRRMLREG